MYSSAAEKEKPAKSRGGKLKEKQKKKKEEGKILEKKQFRSLSPSLVRNLFLVFLGISLRSSVICRFVWHPGTDQFLSISFPFLSFHSARIGWSVILFGFSAGSNDFLQAFA